MSGSTFGHLFCVTNFGESHGPAIGCVIDGCPPGMRLAEADIQPDLDRRRPGTSRHVTQRNEADAVQILSGVYEGLTTGTPIALLIHNTDQRSKDYGNLLDTFRPGHADYTYWRKYGLRDPRGGGRASARLTAPMVAAGAVAKKWLREQHGTVFSAWMAALGEIEIPFESFAEIGNNPFFAPNAGVVPRLEAAMDALRKSGDSVGARIEVLAQGVPAGLGEPLFDKLDADIAYAMMGINAVKGVEIGDGFKVVAQRGSQHGDELSPAGFRSNHAGGVLGGISTGQDLRVAIAIKPTSSIRLPRASIGLFNPYAPLWFQSLGFSTLAIGAIASLLSWTRVVVPYAWSWVGDHWGHGARRIDLLRIATALIVAASLGLLAFTAPAAVTAIVVLIFLANGAVVPLSEAAVAQHLTTDEGFDVGRYGRVRMWGSVGFLVAVSVFGALLQASGIAALPAFVVLAFVLLAASTWGLPRRAGATVTAQPAALGGVWRVLAQPVVAWFFAGVFFTVLAHTALYAFLSLYLDGLGYGKGAVGALWAVSVAAEIAFFWTQGHWFARWSAHTWLIVAAVATALRFAAMAVLGGGWLVLGLAQSLHALTFAAHHAACISVIDRHFRGALRGRGQALYATLGYGLSGVIGGVAGGAISQRWGFAALFAAAAGAALVATACCWRSRVLSRSTA